MDTRYNNATVRHRPNADAIVMVNPVGLAVDCNNEFARLCGVPAGLIVGRPLAKFAPQLAQNLAHDGQEVLAATPLTFNGDAYELSVRPFAETSAAQSGRTADELNACEQIVTLRALAIGQVA